jgi:multidrug efflux pump
MSTRRRLAALSLAALVGLAAVAPVRADCEGARPILYLAFSSDSLSADQVADYADRIVRDRLRLLPGVADVAIYGDRHPVMRIELDRSRLSALGLAPHDVEQALRSQDIEFSSNRTDRATIELPMSAFSARSPGEIGEIVLAKAGDHPVRLMDVASLELASGGARTVANYHGRDVVALGVVNHPNAGMLAVWFAVSQVLPSIRSAMPRDMQLEVASPFSIVIERGSDE